MSHSPRITGGTVDEIKELSRCIAELVARMDKIDQDKQLRTARRREAVGVMWKEFDEARYGVFLYHCLAIYAGDVPDVDCHHTPPRVKVE